MYVLRVAVLVRSKPEVWNQVSGTPNWSRSWNRNTSPAADIHSSSPGERPLHHRATQLESRRRSGPASQSQLGPIQVKAPGHSTPSSYPLSTRKRGQGGSTPRGPQAVASSKRMPRHRSRKPASNSRGPTPPQAPPRPPNRPRRGKKAGFRMRVPKGEGGSPPKPPPPATGTLIGPKIKERANRSPANTPTGARGGTNQATEHGHPEEEGGG
ncbi:hypothetical protein NDU88_009427 [Pleurodeles waltl]|uniref:Uncharacterized protein n=1 Tax=Pleurodeles waltl TaxID=8319 RepID=A0AAV7RZP1_PLEWA|nr:hypothetical protein NDU88_009427 [Pleurodeles waltl]